MLEWKQLFDDNWCFKFGDIFDVFLFVYNDVGW